jgi:drug/metabolite transporter (DMT)-like permease
VQAYDAGRWLLLATLWSLQFLFLRVAVPVFGTAPVAEARAVLAALCLLPWALYVVRERIELRARWKDHLTVGLVNNVLPFLCFAWAAGSLPAGYLAIMNGLVPLWGALIAAPVLGERFGPRRAAGFTLGIAGVALTVNLGPIDLDAGTLLATGAALLGTALWGWAGVMIKQRTERVPLMGLAAGSMAFSAVILAPLWALTPPAASWTVEAAVAVLLLGVLCSGLAYLPFFTLIRDIGPSRTLTVGLAVPVLGVAWGWLLLDEAVTAAMLLGMVLVLVALALVQRR